MASTPDVPRLGGFADYAIGELIGRGLAGPLYEARYLPTGHAVALEMIPHALARDHAFHARLVEECRLATSVRDVAAVAVYDVISDDHRLAVVTELVRGSRLCDLQGALMLPARAAVTIADSILGVLVAVHREGAIHGRISRDTVLVASDGSVRLGGFGVGRALCSDLAPVPSTDTAAVAELVADLLGMPLGEKGRPNDELTPVRAVLRRAVASDRRRRYRTAPTMRAAFAASATEVFGNDWRERGRDALQKIAAHEHLEATQPSSRQRTKAAEWRVRRRLRRVAVGVAAAVASAAVGLIVGFVVATVGGPRASAESLRLAEPVRVQVEPIQASCAAAFAVSAIGHVQGQGTLVYHWDRSDGLRSENQTLHIGSNDSAFDITERWTLVGEHPPAALTLRITSPAAMSISIELPYSCP